MGRVKARQLIERIGGGVQDRFVSNRMILSFEEYLEQFHAEPRRQARSAAQYLRDAMDHYGVDEVQTPAGVLRRFRLFDGLDGADDGEAPAIRARVAGQEEVQTALYRQLSNFVRAGRVNRLLLLHGPNGSAKTSIVAALARALEDYSRRPEGARYRFNWIFPSEKLVKGSIGFGASAGSSAPLETYAHLEGEVIDARLVCEMKDPPLFLIPRAERRRLLVDATRPSERGSEHEDAFVLADYMLDGELCHKCRAIYDALLAHYAGDWLKVLQHIQVERFHVSRRYLTAAVTVEPQLSVDADIRQVTADHSHGALPAALHNLALYQPTGPLVDGNRGVVEFSDLLKRPLEAYKYLLGTCETATAHLGSALLQLDEVLLATSNDKHLNAFKELGDFASFKARIELIRVPYLRRWSVERRIYDDKFDDATVGKHLAPHATRVAARWAVLTRLKKPLVDRWKGSLRSMLDDLTPAEKLELYDSGQAPDRLNLQQARELRGALDELYREYDAYPSYEGRSGASAREMKTMLLNAAQNRAFRCLTPQAVLEELSSLVKDKSVYEFLQQDRLDGYHDHEEFVRTVEGDTLDVLDEEIRDSMGLVSERQYRDLFERYVQHVIAWQKGEKLKNRITGEYERADDALMDEVEHVVMGRGQDRREFRRSVIASIGAYRLDHAEGDLDYPLIFPDLFRHLRDHYFDERKRTLRKNKEDVLRYLGDERDELGERERRQVEQMLDTMKTRYGYCEHCAKDAILFLMRRRYAD